MFVALPNPPKSTWRRKWRPKADSHLLNVVAGEQAFSAIQFSGPPVSIGLIDNFNNVSLAERKLVGILSHTKGKHRTLVAKAE